ncbi:transposable element Tcb1 transposase [Trichonephila clavipes]|nr:transposable element Tcb1 transposase [Trichonephila clavipes]
MNKTVWSARRVARQLGRSGCVMRRFGKLWNREMPFTRRPSSGRHRQTCLREDHHISSAALEETGLQRNGTRSSLATNPDSISAVMTIVFVCGDAVALNPAFALQRHTAPTAGVRVWCAIAYSTRSPLVMIRGTMTAEWYPSGTTSTCVAPHATVPRSHFSTRHYSASHSKGVSGLNTVTTLSCPVRLPDLSPIEHICDHLGGRVGNSTSLNELEARLQQIWNEMSHHTELVFLNAQSYRIMHSH